MRDISSPLDGFASPFGPGRRTLTNLLFGQNEPGFTFEPWDITTLYQDRAGTTPVTAAGQSVGLRLSKDQGLRIGPELVTNGTFDTDLSGWAVTNVIWSAGSASFTGAPSLSQSMSTTSGVTYRVTISVSGLVGGSLWLRFIGGTASNTPTFSNGTTTFLLKSNGNTALLIEQASGAITAGSIDNISVRELAGNHEVAVSDAKRGVYGWMPKTGRRNLLTYTEQFDNAAWGNAAGTVGVTANATTAPNDTLTADKLVPASATNWMVKRQAPTFTAVSHVLSVWAKLSDAGVHLELLASTSGGNGGAVFNLSTGAVITSASCTTSVSADDGNGWRRYSIIFTPAAGSGVADVRVTEASTRDTQMTGNGSKGILIWGAQLETGSSATAYQRVVSQYDITEAGVPTCYYVQADGVDDAYVTPTITPNTDKVQMFAGVRKLITSTAVFLEFGPDTNANNGAAAFYLSENALDNTFVSRGTFSTLLRTAISSPYTKVLTGLGDISGDSAILRVNGTQAVQSTVDQGTGNYLAYPAYIYGRAGTSLPFNGLDFGHAVRFGPNLDAATIARVESLIARNTPEVTL